MDINERKKIILKTLISLIFILFIGYLTIKLWPIIKTGEIIEKIRGFGSFGVIAFLSVQVAQVLAAFLPGEPIEVAAGILYGAWLGTLLCLLGIAAGTVIIYYFVKALGVKSVENNPRFEKFKFLKDPNKAYRMVFILFLIPGTPKDILTYFGPFIPIKPSKFFSAAILGRIPSVITSTLAGSAIYEGDKKMAVIYFSIAAGISVIGIFLNKKIEEKMNRASSKKEK